MVPFFYNLHDILLYIRRGTSKLLELVCDPFEQFNKMCSKRKRKEKIENVRIILVCIVTLRIE